MWTVYKHVSPSNKVYIGITSKEPVRRFGCQGQGYKNNAHFWSAIQKYGWDNFEHEILASGLTEDEAGDLEKRLIEKYDSSNPQKGYNIALGGQYGLLGEETKQKLSKKAKQRWSDQELRNQQSARSKKMWNSPGFREKRSGENHPNYGKHHLNEDARRRISEARKQLGSPWAKGRVWTEEDRAKMSEAVKKTHPHLKMSDEAKEKERIAKLGSKNPNYGKPMSDEQKQMLIKINSKPVIQIKEDSCVKYSSSAEAGRITGICASNINRACRKERLRAGGYEWRYAE